MPPRFAIERRFPQPSWKKPLGYLVYELASYLTDTNSPLRTVINSSAKYFARGKRKPPHQLVQDKKWRNFDIPKLERRTPPTAKQSHKRTRSTPSIAGLGPILKKFRESYKPALKHKRITRGRPSTNRTGVPYRAYPRRYSRIHGAIFVPGLKKSRKQYTQHRTYIKK